MVLGSEPRTLEPRTQNAEPRTPQPRTRVLLGAHALRRLGRLLLGLLLRLLGLLAGLSRLTAAFALHVDAAAEVGAFGDGDARRDDVAVDRAVVPDVDLVAGGDVAGHLAENDDRLGEYLRLDTAVGPDRQHMITELNRALDVTFDGQVFATVQLAFDDDRLPYVHDVLLHVMTRLNWTRCGRSRRGWRGRLRRSRRLSGRRSN